MIAALDHDHITYALQWIVTHAHYVLFWLVPSPLSRRKKVIMDLFSKLPLVGLFGTVLTQVEDPNGVVHGAVKAAAAAFGNDTEKRLAADDALWAKLVQTAKNVADLVKLIEQDVA